MSGGSANRRQEDSGLDGFVCFRDQHAQGEDDEYFGTVRTLKSEDTKLVRQDKGSGHGGSARVDRADSSCDENQDMSCDEDEETTTRMPTACDAEPSEWSDKAEALSLAKEGASDRSVESSPASTWDSKLTSRKAPHTHSNAKRSATNSPASTPYPACQSSSTLLSMIHEDVLTNVIAFIDVSEVPKASAVCRAFARLCQCDNVWRDFCRREHGPDLPRLLDVYDEVLRTGEPDLWKRTYRATLDYKIELHFVTGPRQGEVEKVEIEAGKECMMGRSRKNNICVLQDEMVSRTHAKLLVKDHRYHIVDLGSINGTCINNLVITPLLERRLRINDEVEMGNSTFRVDAANPNEAAEEPEEDMDVPANTDDEEAEDHGDAEEEEEAVEGADEETAP
mmetsp:Transcript_6246/g.15759  ORF Transcript_6246/g.15759 Transcript_6246/m.15759 type:complete len:394 (+) Transcript_6246:381-1562(+)